MAAVDVRFTYTQYTERDKRQVERERDQAIAEKERQLRRVNQQLEESKPAQ